MARWILPLLSILLLLLVSEMGMRLVGAALLEKGNEINIIDPGDAHRIRILAIGESTTAEYFAGERGKAWPHLLESRLRASGIDTRVYNEGLGGTNTMMIMSHLPEYLEKYRPHIVIAMMGINDSASMRFAVNDSPSLSERLSEIKLVKLITWIAGSLDRYRYCRLDFSSLDTVKHKAALDAGISLAKSGVPFEKVAEAVTRLSRSASPHELAQLFTGIAIALRVSQKDAALTLPYIDYAAAIYPQSEEVAFRSLMTYNDLAGNLDDSDRLSALKMREKFISLSEKLLECGPNLPDNILAMISFGVPWSPKIANHPVFQSRGMILNTSNDFPTGEHYRYMSSFLKRKGVHLVAMQYPTLPVDSLKAYFPPSTAEEIAFVSNERNFADALKSHPYDEVFYDRFRGSWGHTTDFGSELIAEAALPTVAKIAGKARR